MSKWQRNICLNPEWDQAKDGEITYRQLAASIAKKLRAIRPFKAELDDINEQLDEIAMEFEGMAEDLSTSMSDIDSAMYELYEWGDVRLDDAWNGKRVCFVDTISTGTKQDRVRS